MKISKKNSLLVSVFVALSFVLSGCFVLDGKVTVTEAGTFSGEAQFSMESELWRSVQSREGQDSTEGVRVIEGVNQESFSEDGQEGYRYTFTETSIKELRHDPAGNLPFSIDMKTTEGKDTSQQRETQFIFRGDFSRYFMTKEELETLGVLYSKKPSAPDVNLDVQFPNNFYVIAQPDGFELDDKNPSHIVIDSDFIKENKSFSFTLSTIPPKGTEVKLQRPSQPAPDTSAYPLPEDTRLVFPLYIMYAVIVGGVATLLYAHFGRKR